MSGLSRSWDKGGERNWPWCVIGCTRKAGMEPSTWCTRRLGGGVATSAESTIAVTLAKLGATTTSSRLSSDASAIIPQPDPCPSSSPQHHDHGPFPSLCDLCERLRGGRLVSGGRSETDEEEEGGRGRMTRRGRSVADRGHASPAGVVSAKDRRRPDDGPSSSGCVSSVVRWNSTRSARSLPATSHEQQTLTWTILFLFLVLVFSASADLQKPTSRERSSKEEGGESISLYIYLLSFRSLDHGLNIFFSLEIDDSRSIRVSFFSCNSIACVSIPRVNDLTELDSFLFPFLGILGQSRSAKGRTLVFVDPLENIDRIYPLERKY